MGFEWTDMSYQEKEAEGSGAVVFLFALVFVYLILAAQYESWSLPLSVLMGTPIAVFGAIGGLWIARMFSESYENNVFAQIGLVMLIGLAAKNAILIVEFANKLQEQGAAKLDAVHQAAMIRLRPVLMTASAATLGFIPMALSHSPGAELQRPLATVVIGGLVTATALTLLVLPTAYGLVERWREAWAKKRSATNPGFGGSPEPAPAAGD